MFGLIACQKIHLKNSMKEIDSDTYTVLSVEFQSLLSQIIKVVTKLISVLIVAKFYF